MFQRKFCTKGHNPWPLTFKVHEGQIFKVVGIEPGFRHFAANNLSLVPHHVDHFYNLAKNYHIVSSLTSETIYIVKYRSWTIIIFRLVILQHCPKRCSPCIQCLWKFSISNGEDYAEQPHAQSNIILSGERILLGHPRGGMACAMVVSQYFLANERFVQYCSWKDIC